MLVEIIANEPLVRNDPQLPNRVLSELRGQTQGSRLKPPSPTYTRSRRMMTAAERARIWRQQRIAKGVCLSCPRPADYGSYCRLCSRRRASVIRQCVTRLRTSIDFWKARGWQL